MRFVGIALISALFSFVAAPCALRAAEASTAITLEPANPVPQTAPVASASSMDQTSRVSVARSYEAQLREIQKKIVLRKHVLTNENVAVRTADAELTAARQQMMTIAGKRPEIVELDKAHAEQLKAFAQMDAKLNRLRTHWTTHNKPVRNVNGTTNVVVAALPGCPFCQKDFDKFIANDQVLVKEYESTAAKMVDEMTKQRAHLLQFSISRAALVRKAVGQDPELKKHSDRIAELEKKCSDLWAQDQELASLTKQLDDVRAQMVAMNAVRASGGSGGSKPRTRKVVRKKSGARLHSPAISGPVLLT